MKVLTLVPVEGKDEYPSLEAAIADWNAGSYFHSPPSGLVSKDFRIADTDSVVFRTRAGKVLGELKLR